MPRLGLPRLERLVNYYSTLDQQALECHDAGSAPKDRDAKAAAPRADAKHPQAASPRQALNVLEASNANQARLVPGGTTPERGTPERERAAISVLTPKPTPKGAARPTPRRTPRATPKRTPMGPKVLQMAPPTPADLASPAPLTMSSATLAVLGTAAACSASKGPALIQQTGCERTADVGREGGHQVDHQVDPADAAAAAVPAPAEPSSASSSSSGMTSSSAIIVSSTDSRGSMGTSGALSGALSGAGSLSTGESSRCSTDSSTASSRTSVGSSRSSLGGGSAVPGSGIGATNIKRLGLFGGPARRVVAPNGTLRSDKGLKKDAEASPSGCPFVALPRRSGARMADTVVQPGVGTPSAAGGGTQGADAEELFLDRVDNAVQAGETEPQAGETEPQAGETEPQAGETEPQAGETEGALRRRAATAEASDVEGAVAALGLISLDRISEAEERPESRAGLSPAFLPAVTPLVSPPPPPPPFSPSPPPPPPPQTPLFPSPPALEDAPSVPGASVPGAPGFITTRGGAPIVVPAADSLLGVVEGVSALSMVEEAGRAGDFFTRHAPAWNLVLLSLPSDEVQMLMPLVCRGLRAMSEDATCLASLLGCLGAGSASAPLPTAPMLEWREIEDAFPCGRFLAEGGFKQVFRVHDSCKRTRVLSVLDRLHLRKLNLEEALITELWVTHLLARLARDNRCAHFLQLHRCFVSGVAPPHEWGEEDDRGGGSASATDESDGESTEGDEPEVVPARSLNARASARNKPAAKPPARRKPPPKSAPCYQYMIMEHAKGGDMEEACKALPEAMWTPVEVAALFLQMVYSLHVAQAELQLRHYDVKLLNFFLTTAEELVPPHKAAATRAVRLRYGVCGRCYAIEMDVEEPMLAMLADFGTADIAPDSFDEPIDTRHFTTLENAPPDFLLAGAHARQDFAADSFSLALCLVHMLTGHAPYEEVLAPLRCPPELRDALEHIWNDGADGQYAPVAQQLEADEEHVLCDTLYRYLAMFGTDSLTAERAEREGDGGAIPPPVVDVRGSPAWQAVLRWLGSGSGSGRFARDQQQWSLFGGKQKVIAEARRRMAALPGCEELLRGLASFDPGRRWSMQRALRADMFGMLSCAEASEPPQGDVEVHLVEYLHYMDQAPQLV